MSEKRKFARIPIAKQIKVKFRDKEHFVSNYISDISLGGMLLKSGNILPIGTVFNFEFEIELNFPKITGKGIVVRTAKDDSGKTVGMGIKFISLDSDSRRLLPYLIRNLSENSEGSQR
jgi:uncharacterized protein (TIGR02266 family)